MYYSLSNAQIVGYNRFRDETFEIPLSTYPDGTPLFNIEDVPPIDVLVLRPISLLTFYAALMLVDAHRDRVGRTPILVLPLVPGSRQDRLNFEGDYLFTAKSIAAELNLRNFPSVYVIDAHSDVTPAVINNSMSVSLGNLDLPITYTGVIAPDGGAIKRAGTVAKCLSLPLFHGWKKRDVSTGKLSGFGVEPLPPGHFLVVDDLCDGGGTFIGLAEAIVAAQPEATMDLFVTHGLFTRGLDELLTHYDTIITTDSTVHDRDERLVVLNLTEELLEVVLQDNLIRI